MKRRSTKSGAIQLVLDAMLSDAGDEDSTRLNDLPACLEVDITKFPRRGHKIAPLILAPLLNVPVDKRRASSILLKDLDESAWNRFSPDTCARLGKAVGRGGSPRRGRLGQPLLPERAGVNQAPDSSILRIWAFWSQVAAI